MVHVTIVLTCISTLDVLLNTVPPIRSRTPVALPVTRTQSNYVRTSDESTLAYGPRLESSEKAADSRKAVLQL